MYGLLVLLALSARDDGSAVGEHIRHDGMAPHRT